MAREQDVSLCRGNSSTCPARPSAGTKNTYRAHPVPAYSFLFQGLCPQPPGISYETGASKAKVHAVKYVVVA